MRNEHDAYHALAKQRKLRYMQKQEPKVSKIWAAVAIITICMWGYFFYQIMGGMPTYL